jgi:hypothetical protein
MTALVTVASRGMGTVGYTAGVDILWDVYYRYYGNFRASIETLCALMILDAGNADIVKSLNQLLADQNTSYRSGGRLDYEVFLASVQALGVLKSSTSFPLLFSALTIGYPEAVIQTVTDAALASLGERNKAFLLGVIRDNPVKEKLIALRLAEDSPNFSDALWRELAESALTISLSSNEVNAEDRNNLRNAAMRILRRTGGI